MRVKILLGFVMFTACVNATVAQTTTFTYQGKLSDGATPANGNYDFEFRLFDMLNSGAQQGATVQRLNVAVTNGIFTVELDFGNQFSGASRFLDISVRPAGGGTFTQLAPRQQMTSNPYAIKSLNATTADGLSLACVNCITSGQIGSVNGGAVVGTIPVASVPAGSANYIQNSSSQQASSNFNISGDGTANILNATTQYNIGGLRALSAPGSFNFFAGVGAGQNNTTGSSNSFFGSGAGLLNTTGFNNTYVGVNAGFTNTTGTFNSFFGSSAGSNNTASANSFFGGGSGFANTTGGGNSFFGASAGSSNTTGDSNAFFGNTAGQFNTTARANSFFGANAGRNNIANDNAFFGTSAGLDNTTGTGNTFLGRSSGLSNTAESNNTFIGINSNGAAGITNSTAIGANAVVTTSNTMVLGTNAVTVEVPGSFNVAGTFGANILNATTQFNIGGTRVMSLAGVANVFVGADTGTANTGTGNSFFGAGAGAANTTGESNAFFGASAGSTNTTSVGNAFFGWRAGYQSTGGSNSFFGSGAGETNAGVGNTFVGNSAGLNNTTGDFNAFVGYITGYATTSGASNSFFGYQAGSTNTTGFENTVIGAGADVGSSNLSFATAIGAGAVASLSNSIYLGRASGADVVRIPGAVVIDGTLVVGSFGSAGSTSICLNAANRISPCSSSLRYKTSVQSYKSGLEVVRRLSPITFNWKEGGMADVGFGAEEVDKIEPLLTTRNDKGEIEGVKYGQLTTVLVNAVNEQQAQIGEQQRTITQQQQRIEQQHTFLIQQQNTVEALKKIVCQSNPGEPLCKQ